MFMENTLPSCSSLRLVADQQVLPPFLYESNAMHRLFSCEACDRAFKSQTSLDEHYRGSPNHPNCFVCGRGFKNQDLCDAHHDEAHPRVVCSICRITMYEHELPQHLKESPRHPTCELCTDALGFESDAEFSLHCKTMHAESYCIKCRRVFTNAKGHYLDSVVHPKCEWCQDPVGFAGEREYTEHVKAVHFGAMKFPAPTPSMLSFPYPHVNEQEKANEAMVHNLIEESPRTAIARPQFIFNPFDDDDNTCIEAPTTSGRRLSVPTRGSPPSLSCRHCFASPCRETTATMCGHVFCKGCITESVASTSRCPACGEMTLLYMLFKLHLN
ncbi:hypothetical protein EV421DRAFT_924858 [Armillaria borealis]|uniref:RING-type domain-containing protein n=1 Tax=Armillaria borealis TaxID=47425 RepID=A0AA39ML60_9AGAR|nr:hypothetical protein EV421DRAFT_924858 [Armillaria borealis]